MASTIEHRLERAHVQPNIAFESFQNLREQCASQANLYEGGGGQLPLLEAYVYGLLYYIVRQLGIKHRTLGHRLLNTIDTAGSSFVSAATEM